MDKEMNNAKRALATLNTKALDRVRIPVLRELCIQMLTVRHLLVAFEWDLTHILKSTHSG